MFRMFELLAQVTAGAALYVWVCVWLMPGVLLLLGAPGRRRMYRRLLALAGTGALVVFRSVKAALTPPRRRRAARYVPARIQSASMDALVQPVAGRPPTVAGPELWAPARTAAMPTVRCNACPVWGCPAQGDNPECAVVHAYRPSCPCERCSSVVSYEEATTHESREPVAYVPTARASVRGNAVPPDDEAMLRSLLGAQFGPGGHVTLPSGRSFTPPQGHGLTEVDVDAIARAVWDRTLTGQPRDEAGLRFRLAQVEARRPRPLDDEVARPPRDLFDAHTPPLRVRPPEKRLAASMPCPFCGGQPMMGREVSEDGELRAAWQEVHRKRCVLYKRPPRRPRPSGAQRRKLREQIEKGVTQARETPRCNG